jgi:hypothetical protein
MIELFMSQRAFFYSSLGLPMAGVTHGDRRHYSRV